MYPQNMQMTPPTSDSVIAMVNTLREKLRQTTIHDAFLSIFGLIILCLTLIYLFTGSILFNSYEIINNNQFVTKATSWLTEHGIGQEIFLWVILVGSLIFIIWYAASRKSFVKKIWYDNLILNLLLLGMIAVSLFNLYTFISTMIEHQSADIFNVLAPIYYGQNDIAHHLAIVKDVAVAIVSWAAIGLVIYPFGARIANKRNINKMLRKNQNTLQI